MSHDKSENSSSSDHLMTGVSGDESEADDKGKLGSRRKTEGNGFFEAIKNAPKEFEYKKVNLVPEELKVLPLTIKKELLMYKRPSQGLGKITRKEHAIVVDPEKELLTSIFKNTKQVSKIHQSEIKLLPPIMKIEIQPPSEHSGSDSVDMTNKAVVIQSRFKGYLAKKKFKLILKPFRYRKHILTELIKTDFSFIESLKKVVEKVIIPARSRGLLNGDEIKRVFWNLEVLIGINQLFFKTLKDQSGVEPKETKESKDIKLVAYNPHTTLVAKDLEKIIPGFRMYNEYCFHFEDSISFLKKLREAKNHPFISDLLNKIEETEELENLNLDSLLVKPVQRLPKYVLLFRDLLKHTDEKHPDYLNVQKALKLFVEINEENNKRMDRYLRDLKMFELEKNFGSPELKILDSRRGFISEETLGLVVENLALALPSSQIYQPVICYILTDLILITRKTENGDQLMDYITLTPNSFVKDIPDTKYFSNLFSIIGESSCLTFSADDKEHKIKHMKQVNDLLDILKKKIQNKKEMAKNLDISDSEFMKNLEVLSRDLTVNVVGTEERNITNLANRHTVYKVEIKYNDFIYKIDIRYSEMVSLEKLIKEKYQNIKIPHLSTTNWFTYRKTKIIEGRKLLIENFLHQILLNERIIKDPDMVLSCLNLPMDFHETVYPAKSDPLINIKEEKPKREGGMENLFPHQKNVIEEFNFRMTKGRSTADAGTIARTEPSKKEVKDDARLETKPSMLATGRLPSFVRESYKEEAEISLPNVMRESRSFKFKEMRASKMQLETELLKVILMNGETLEVNITKTSRAIEICEVIQNKLQMNASMDFRLFWGADERDLFVMADEEIVYKVKSEMAKEESKNNNSNSNSNSVDKHFERQRPVNDSSTEFINSSTLSTLSTLTSPERPQPRRSFFEKIKGKVQNMFKKDITFYFKKYVFLPKKLEQKEFLVDRHRMKLLAYQVIQEVHNMMYVLENKNYIYYAGLYLNLKLGEYREIKEQQIIEEIKAVIPPIILSTGSNQNWAQQIKANWKKQTEDLVSSNKDIIKNYGSSAFEIMASSLILRTIQDNELYGVTLFLVQTHKAAEFSQDSFPKSVYLGVDYNSIRILHPGSKHLLLHFGLEIIQNILHYPKMIIIELATKRQRFRFNTYKSLEIKELISEYKLLKDFCGSPRQSSKK